MCDKVSFTKPEAEAALKKAAKSYKPYRKERRMYFCHTHNAWHLTSQESIHEQPKPKKVKLNFKKQWAKLLKTK